MPRFAVLVSGRGSNLQSLIDQLSGMDAEIVVVASDVPEVYALERARAAGIATVVVDGAKMKRNKFEARLIEELEGYRPDWLLLAGFMRVISAHFIAAFSGRILNIHPSLLPKYRGLNTHARAIADQASEHGASVHLVTEKLDDGPIILQAKVTVDNNDNADSLAAKVLAKEHEIYPQVVEWLVAERLQFKQRQPYFDGSPLRSPMIW